VAAAAIALAGAAPLGPARRRNGVPLSDFYDQVRSFWRYLAWGIGSVTLSVLMLR